MKHVDVPRLLVAVAGALTLYVGVSLAAPGAPAGVQPLPPAQGGDAAQVAPGPLAREGAGPLLGEGQPGGRLLWPSRPPYAAALRFRSGA